MPGRRGFPRLTKHPRDFVPKAVGRFIGRSMEMVELPASLPSSVVCTKSGRFGAARRRRMSRLRMGGVGSYPSARGDRDERKAYEISTMRRRVTRCAALSPVRAGVCRDR